MAAELQDLHISYLSLQLPRVKTLTVRPSQLVRVARGRLYRRPSSLSQAIGRGALLLFDMDAPAAGLAGDPVDPAEPASSGEATVAALAVAASVNAEVGGTSRSAAGWPGLLDAALRDPAYDAAFARLGNNFDELELELAEELRQAHRSSLPAA